MKKIISIAFIIILSFSLSGCNFIPGNSLTAKVTIGKSEIFSDIEISDAINVVKSDFLSYFGCTMTAIKYDEKRSKAIVGSYLEEDSEDKTVTKDNTIIIYCDFITGNDNNEGMESNAEYKDWTYTLSRSSPKSKWTVKNYGYC